MQATYSWTSLVFSDEEEPGLWYHDVLKSDGTPYDQAELKRFKDFYKGINGAFSSRSARQLIG